MHDNHHKLQLHGFKKPDLQNQPNKPLTFDIYNKHYSYSLQRQSQIGQSQLRERFLYGSVASSLSTFLTLCEC